MIRAFIAIEIPAEVRAGIAGVQARLKRAPGGVRISWVKVENLHLTLEFLGHIDENAVPAIQGALAAVAGRHAPFAVAVRGRGSSRRWRGRCKQRWRRWGLRPSNARLQRI